MADCPKVVVLLESTNRCVDVIREGFDRAIRVRFPPLDDSDLLIRKLADSPQRLAASPSVLKDSARPLVPADLAALPSVALDPAEVEHKWRLDGPTARPSRFVIRRGSSPRTWWRYAWRHCAASASVSFRLVVQDDIKTGRMIDLLPGWAPRAGIIHAAFPSRRGLLPSVRTLLDFLAKEYAALERVDGGAGRH
jgi:DNA-binding transcriptional LysR family regulator